MIKKTQLIAIFTVLMFLLSLIPVTLASPVWTEVGTFNQLKEAIENKTDTHIKLTANIQMDKKGIIINPEKSVLVIDGNGYTLTDAATSAISSTINMKSTGKLKNITVQNINIDGQNYYGIITITDSTLYSDVTVTFDSITYTGPGLSWGRKSNFVIRDSDILIVPSKICPAHEIFECLRVRLEGNVNIVKDAPQSTLELFWITGAKGGVTVASGANVNVISNQNLGKKGSSGFVYYSCPDLHLIFEDDSHFNYVGNNLFQQGSAVDRLIIGERAEVNIVLYGELYCTYGVFSIRGEANVGKGAVLKLYSFNNNQKQPLLQLTGVGSINFNSPKEVFIYNSSTKSGNTALALGPNGCDVTINYNDVKTIEYWKLNTAPHTNLPVPTYLWRNPDESKFSASERISGSTVKSATSTNYFGTPTWSTTTVAVKDINVVRITGGYSGKVCTVNFEVNGGHPKPETQFVKIGELAEKPTNPAKNGYTFEAWYVNPDFSGSPWDFDNNNVIDDIVLYAKWTIINFNINYTLHGGTNALGNPVSYNVENAHLLSVADPELRGYTFLYWMVQCANGTLFALSASGIPAGTTGDLAMFAVWDPVPILYTIKYELAGGVNAAGNPVEYAVTSLFPVDIANPTRTGYLFLGWVAVYSNGTMSSLSPSYSIPAGSACDVTMYAYWSPIIQSYSISYVLTDGINAHMNPVSYTVNNLPLSIADPYRSGYVFSHWVMRYADGSEVILQNGVIPIGTVGDVTLTAIWTIAPSYSITYSLNGGVNAAGNPTTYTVSNAPVGIADPSMAGYTFSYWIAAYADGSLNILPFSGIPAGTTGNITLIAIWV